MRSRYIFISILVYVIVTGCSILKPILSEDQPSEAFPIDGIWMLEELDGKVVENNELRRGRPMLNFKTTEKKLSGRTGCNDFGATFSTNENRIEIEMGAMTRVACPGGLEERFLKGINSVNEFKIVNLSLYLLEGRNTRMIFRRSDERDTFD